MANEPITVTARDGDVWCNLAVQHGFKDCRKVRDANPAIAARDLRPGDRVTIPAVTPKEESRPVDALHRFERLGAPVGRVFFIQDRNRATPELALSDRQRQLAITNYVIGRQGRGFAPAVWRDRTFFGFDDLASADPDHFKMQVFDRRARDAGQTDITVRLQTQRPRLDAAGLQTAWEDVAGVAGVQLDVTCRQVAPNSPWYRSHYMRVVVEPDDQNNRPADNVDPGDDRTAQTIVAPLISDDTRVEILDLRVQAAREAERCGATGAETRCRGLAFAEIGKREVAMKIRVFRVNGSGPQAALTTPDQIRNITLQNLKMHYAQCNIGLDILEIKDVPLPRNMIAVGDDNVVKASGGHNIGATVSRTAGGATTNVTATINTNRKDTPEQTANRLAAALRAQGLKVKVSPNQPRHDTGDDFGPCDILCFNPDDTPANIVRVHNAAGEQQKLRHTGAWNNNAVTTSAVQYGANEFGFRLIGSADYRALLKNNFVSTSQFHTYVVNDFVQPGPGTLLGEALIPYHEVNADIRPRDSFTMGVLISNNAALRRTVLTHEAGHVMLDAIHTSNNNQDWQGNADNRRLAFSEIMTQFDSSTGPDDAPQPFLHKRLSDGPLTVEFQVAFGRFRARTEVFGVPPLDTTVERFRNLFSAVFGPLRRLRPAPGSNL